MFLTWPPIHRFSIVYISGVDFNISAGDADDPDPNEEASKGVRINDHSVRDATGDHHRQFEHANYGAAQGLIYGVERGPVALSGSQNVWSAEGDLPWRSVCILTSRRTWGKT